MSDLFKVSRGIDIGGQIQILQSNSAPGSSTESNAAPVGSLYINTSTGTTSVKLTAGSGADKWSVQATEDFVQTTTEDLDHSDLLGLSDNDHPQYLLRNGSQSMTGELILSGNPSNVLGATPKQYVDAISTAQAAHNSDTSIHLTSAQNTLLDGLSATLTSSHLNFVEGVTSNIQTQLNAKQASDTDLTALANTSTTGIYVRTGSGTSATRTLSAGSTKISISNGDGVSGNPSIDVDPSNISHTDLADVGTNSHTEIDNFIADERTLNVDLCSSGVISGGALSVGAGDTIDIDSGAGYVNTGTAYQKISWSAASGVAAVADGINYVAIDENGDPVITTSVPADDTIALGTVFVEDGAVVETFSLPNSTDNFQNRVQHTIDAIGALVVSGSTVSEKIAPDFLQLDISPGIIVSKLGRYDTIATDTFTKRYNSSDLGWEVDTNDPNEVNTTHWNDITQPAAAALVALRAGYWKKDLIIQNVDGSVSFVYGQAEYQTYEQAERAPVQFLPPSGTQNGERHNSVILATIICKQGDTTVANRIKYFRPNFNRVFGNGVDEYTGENTGYAHINHEHGVGGFTNSSTGLLTGGQVTINVVNTLFNVSAGAGLIVNNTTDPLKPSHKIVSWDAMTGVTVTNLATQAGTYVGMDDTGTLVQSATPFTYEQSRSVIPLAFLFHRTHTNIVAVISNAPAAFDPGSRLNDLMTSIGIINLTGNQFSPNGANLKLNRSAGNSHVLGGGFQSNKQKPDIVTDAASTGANFQLSYRDGAGDFTVIGGVSNIDTTKYDDGSGTLADIPTGEWVSIPIFYVPGLGTTGTRVQYPQRTFATKAEALANTPDPFYEVNTTLVNNATIRTYIVVQEGTTDLSDPDVTFIQTGKFSGLTIGSGAGGGGGGGAPTDASYLVTVADPTLTNEKVIGTDFFITDSHVGASAGIAESKLALNFATHTSANDPTTTQKEALAGTNGTPSTTNRYVTDSDPRNTNARTPTSHVIITNAALGAEHTISGGTAGHVFKATGATTAQLMQLAHSELSGAGSNSHATIDSHIASTSNPHQTSLTNLNDTDITSPADLDLFYYDDGDSVWKNASRSTLGIARSGANTDITSVVLNQSGLVVKGADNNALTIKPNETLTAARILNIITGDADRTLTFAGDATISGTHSGTSSGTNTGDQTITLTSDVTGSGTGSFATTIANNVVSYAKMQDVSAASRLLGRGSAAGAGDPQELTVSTGLTISGTALAPANDLAAVEALSTAGIATRTGSETWTTRTIIGTTNRISVSNGDGVSGNPSINIDTNYVGQNTITTLGTITTGVWNGTDIAVADGGTGVSSFTAYSVICGGTATTGALQNVSGLGNSGQVLTSAGAGALPTWSDPTFSFRTITIAGQSDVVADSAIDTLTLVAGTNITLTTNAGSDTITIAATGGGGGVTSVDITQPAAGITATGGPITSSGSITLALANDLAALEGLASNGLAARTATSTWTTRTITGTGNQITTSNGDGVSGNPTISIADNVILPGTGSVTLPTGTTAERPGSPTDAMIRHNNTEAILEGYTSPYTTSISPTIFQRTMMYRKRRTWVDEFISGGSGATGTGIYGDLGWSVTSSGTNANAMVTAVADHPGILQLGTGGTSGNSNRMHLGNAVGTLITMANQIEYMSWLIRIPTITSVTIRFGMGTDVSAANHGTAGVFFQFDPAVNAALQFICRSSSTNSTQNTVTIAANTWYLCEAFYNGTTWTPVINGSGFTSISNNIPTVAVNVGTAVVTNTTGSRTLQIDAFSMMTRELGARF